MTRYHLASVVCTLFCAAQVASAQQFVVVNGVVLNGTNDSPDAPPGFTITKADSKSIDTFDDFERYAQKKSWELAFRSVNTILDADSSGMIPSGGGFLVPLKQRLMQSLAKLPPDGKEAYRLFYDAKAKQLFEPFQDPKRVPPADEIKTLRRIVDQYFITSVGDVAADRLADAYFEAGDFGGADHLWALIIREFPETHLSVAKMQAKRALALAHLNRTEELNDLVKTLREQHAGQTLTIGGREVVAADFAASLLSGPSSGISAGQDLTTNVALPAADMPTWQIQIAPPGTLDEMDRQVRTSGWSYYGISFGGWIPPVAFDDHRIYINWMSAIYAADIQTGKILWRFGKASDIYDKTVMLIQTGVSPDRFNITAWRNRVFVTTRNPINNGRNSWTLACLDADTGKQKWSSDALGGDLDFVGKPCIADSVAYVLAVTGANLNLLAIDPETGKQNWRLALGNPRASPNYRGTNDYPNPSLLSANGILYIATNNGALLAVNLSQHRVEWAFQHDTKPISGDRVYYNELQPRPFQTPPVLSLSDGTMYLKDTDARLLYALEPSGPSLEWQRPVSTDETLAALDGKRAYLLGHELSAMDLSTRQLLWSTKIPVDTGDLRPIVAHGHVYVLSSRGIYDIDASNGDVLHIFRGIDRDSPGGRLVVAGDKLLCVTSNAITAYPIGPSTGGK